MVIYPGEKIIFIPLLNGRQGFNSHANFLHGVMAGYTVDITLTLYSQMIPLNRHLTSIYTCSSFIQEGKTKNILFNANL